MKKIAILGSREKFENYYVAVEACHAEAVGITSEDEMLLVKDVDGVIVPGGGDVNPKLYHQENTASADIDDVLDELELKVIDDVVKCQKPLLGICRGHQIINIYFGGDLIQNVENCDIHKRDNNNQDRVHMSNVEKESFLYDIYHEERISTNSAHHQAISKLGTGLKAVQFSDDGLIEAYYHEELPIYCLQWHPERMCLKHERSDTINGLQIFEFFIGNVCQ